jgi:hypothetical protein
LAAAAVLVGVIVLIAIGWWANRGPFGPDPFRINAKSNPSPSIWQILLSERSTLGFARLGIGAVGLFILCSLAALGVSGRWINSLFGARTDPGKEAKQKAMTSSVSEIRRLTKELKKRDDKINSLLDLLDQLEAARQLENQ